MRVVTKVERFTFGPPPEGRFNDIEQGEHPIRYTTEDCVYVFVEGDFIVFDASQLNMRNERCEEKDWADFTITGSALRARPGQNAQNLYRVDAVSPGLATVSTVVDGVKSNDVLVEVRDRRTGRITPREELSGYCLEYRPPGHN